jgi:hypothetical protein
MPRFVDRDMFMRFLGGGVGHRVMKEKEMEPEDPHIQVDGDADAPDQVFDATGTDEEVSDDELEEEEEPEDNQDCEFGPEDGEDGEIEDTGYGEL